MGTAIIGFAKLLVPKTLKAAAVIAVQTTVVVGTVRLIKWGINKSQILEKTKAWVSSKKSQPVTQPVNEQQS